MNKINEGTQTCTVRRLFFPTCSSVIVCFSGKENFLDFFFGTSLEERERLFFVLDFFDFDDLTLSLERSLLFDRNDFMFLCLCSMSSLISGNGAKYRLVKTRHEIKLLKFKKKNLPKLMIFGILHFV